MNSRILICLAAACGSVAPVAAVAQVYGSLSLGPAKVQDLNFRDPSTADLLLDAGSAWQVSGALGYRFSPLLRAELNLGYLDGDAKGRQQQNIVTIAACGITPNNPCLDAAVTADIKGTTALAMGFVDIPTSGPIVPFLGAGIGVGRESLDVLGTARTGAGAGTPFTVLDDADSGFAIRGTAGISIDVGSFQTDLAYAYTRTAKPKMTGRSSFISYTFDRPLRVHALTATARFAF
ncbi:MAG: hypothetical protein FJX59_11885 [Alphaproteobacteria bacterium]|nr:hypothetical protein [Alphaproteobacteria bacterium]